MSTTNTITGRRYAGWLRIGRGPWRKVCEADEYDACRALLDVQADRHQHSDVCVLFAGDNPNRRRIIR